MTTSVVRKPFFIALAVLFAGAALFFGYYSAQVLYLAITFEGEGSLGHVGLYIAGGLLPFLALFFAALAHLAWKAGCRTRPD